MNGKPPIVVSQVQQKPRRKVKTGCRTCKIRKVKCDEGRPACYRCASTGRVCDGYGIWGGGGKKHEERPMYTQAKSAMKTCSTMESGSSSVNHSWTKEATITTPLLSVCGASPSKTVTAEEQLYFTWFARCTTTKLPGVFSMAFWDSLIFQASENEPAVLHAVLALSSAHKRKMLDSSRRDRADLPPDAQEVFMLRHYCKAIENLQPLFKRKSRDSVRVALITCLIFIFLEYLRGHYRVGHVHFENGARLLHELEPDLKLTVKRDGFDTMVQSARDSVEHCITELFARLQVQAEVLGQRPRHRNPILQQDTSAFRNVSTRIFSSPTEARYYLEQVIDGTIHLAELSQLQTSIGEEDKFSKTDQRHLQATLTVWKLSFDRTLKSVNAARHPRDAFAYQILHLFYTMTTIMAATCLSLNDQTCFDNHTSSFLSIIKQAIQIQNTVSNGNVDVNVGSSTNTGMARSIADIGWIPPLYFTALKCRNHRIRLHATRLLNSDPHKEGIWDATLAAIVTRAVIDMEESAFTDRTHLENEDEWPLYEPPTVETLANFPILPAEARFQEVQLALPEEDSGRVVLVCKRRRANGEWEVIRKLWDDWVGFMYRSKNNDDK